MTRWRLPLVALLLCIGAAAHAHKASDAYVALDVDGREVRARMDIALRDLDRDLDLDADADDVLTWKEVRTRWSDIAALGRAGLRLEADGHRCVPAPLADGGAAPGDAPALAEHSDGRYAVLRLRWQCAEPIRRLSVDYVLFARTDPTHRGIVRVARRSEAGPGTDAAAHASSPQLAVMAPDGGAHRFVLPAPNDASLPAIVASAGASAAAADTSSAGTRAPIDARPALDAEHGAPRTMASRRTPSDAGVDATSDASPVAAFGGFVREGVHHILVGYDHILFLLSLLLPAVWVRGTIAKDASATRARARSAWRPAEAWRPALAHVLKVVTAFTVAHSITLALAVFDVVNPPTRWIESAIAASVLLAALNNLWPVISESRWKLTFLFGLVHGFGFASALKDAGLAQGALVAPLLGFNLGVELGQLCIVAAVLPLAWMLRDTRGYRGAFAGGSGLIALVAGVWLVQRAFDLSLIAG